MYCVVAAHLGRGGAVPECDHRSRSFDLRGTVSGQRRSGLRCGTDFHRFFVGRFLGMAGRVDHGCFALEPQSGTFLYLVRAGRSGGFVVRTGPQMDFLSGVAVWLGHRTDYHGSGRILSGGYPASANRRCHVGGSMVRGSFLKSCAQLDAPSGGEASEIRNGGIYHERKSWRESGRNGTALF